MALRELSFKSAEPIPSMANRLILPIGNTYLILVREAMKELRSDYIQAGCHFCFYLPDPDKDSVFD